MNNVKSEFNSVKSYSLDPSKIARAAGGRSPYLRNATINGGDEKAPLIVAAAPCSVVDKIDYTAKLEFKGNVIEFSKTSKPIKIGQSPKQAPEDSQGCIGCFPDVSRVFIRLYGMPESKKPELTEEELRERKERSKKESARRKRKKIADLTNINFSDAQAFLTLTFKDDLESQDAVKEVSKFLNRMNKRFPDFKYLWVLELQQSGRPHFHLLTKGLPEKFFERRWYVKTKKRSKVFQVLQVNGEMGRDFSQVRFFESKKAAKDYARANGRDVAFSSSLVDIWKQGFVHVRELKDRNGEMLSDVGAYMLKYITKEDALPEGVTSYSFSRGKLRQKGFRLLNTAAEKLFAWLQQNIAEYINHMKQYAGENLFLGSWVKMFVSVDRVFMEDFLPEVEDWLGLARDCWGHDGAFYLREGGTAHFPDIGLTNRVLCGLA